MNRIFNGEGNAGPLGSLRLTPRETEVLTWIAQGKTNYEIGVILSPAPPVTLMEQHNGCVFIRH